MKIDLKVGSLLSIIAENNLVEGKVLKRIYSKVSYLTLGLVHKWPNCTECLSLFFPHHLLFSCIYTKHASLLKGPFHPDIRSDKKSDVGKHLLGRRQKVMVLQTDVNQTPKCPPDTCMSSDVLTKSL